MSTGPVDEAQDVAAAWLHLSSLLPPTWSWAIVRANGEIEIRLYGPGDDLTQLAQIVERGPTAMQAAMRAVERYA